MVLITQSGPETLGIGQPAPDFNLPGTDGSTYSLGSFSDAKALVIAFTCNHCPYAQAMEERFKALVTEFSGKGIAFIGINPNDAVNYPDDSFENMKKRAEQQGFNFPYLRDDTQETARAYGAVCTPHYFIVGSDRTLLYEGRLDDNWQAPDQVSKTELRDALQQIVSGESVTVTNSNPMGCSIKWKS